VDLEGDVVHCPEVAKGLGDAGELHDGNVVVGSGGGHEKRSFAEDPVGLSERREQIAGKTAGAAADERDPLRLRSGRSPVGWNRCGHKA
jgi:hypothetical protein